MTALTADFEHPRHKEVEALVEASSKSRMDAFGGYPDDWIILGDLVIIATLAGADGNEPELIVEGVDDFIRGRQDLLDED